MDKSIGQLHVKHLVMFAEKVNALANALPREGEYVPLAECLHTVAHDACAPSIIAVLGVFNAGKSTLINALLGESVLKSDVLPANARVVMLRYGKPAALTAFTNSGLRHTFGLSELHKVAFEGDEHYAAVRKDLAYLVLEIPNQRLRDLVLVDTPGLFATQADHAQSTVSFLNRTDAIIWVTRLTGAARATEVDFLRLIGRPADLLVVNDLDSIDPEEAQDADKEIARIQTRFGHWACRVTGLSAENALRAIHTKDSGLLEESRFPQLCQAIEELSRSTKVRDHKISNTMNRLKELTSQVTERFTRLTGGVDQWLTEGRARLAKASARRAELVGEIRRWERRSSSIVNWVGVAQDQEGLSPELRQRLAAVHQKFNILEQERRSHQTRISSDNEEKLYLERRRAELKQSRKRYESKGFFDRLADRFFGDEQEQLERDTQELEQRSAQHEKEHRKRLKAAADLDRRGREIEAEGRQIAISVVRNLNGRKPRLDDELRGCRAELRRVRWFLQANRLSMDAAAAFNVRCDAIAEAALELVSDVSQDRVAGLDECMRSLQECRHASDKVALLKSAVLGNPKLLCCYRRTLSRQVQLAAEGVEDYSGALAALELAMAWVPKTEIWREASLLAKSEDSPLTHFAEGIAGWLCEESSAAQRAGRALALAQPTAVAMNAVTEFVQKHGREMEDGFFVGVLAEAPKLKRDVLRRAPRFSRTYYRALMMISAELLTALGAIKNSGANQHG